MNLLIINRAATEPGKPSWQQIEVLGEHRTSLGKEAVIQVIDQDAIASMVEEFGKDAKMPHFDGILVDADHLSHDPDQSTEAKAWLVELEIRNNELYGLLDWTDVGAEAVRGKRWKYFSTEYDAGDLTDLGIGPDGVRRVRPRKLAGLALTNRPNNRGGRPITNRKAGDAEQTQTKNDNDMKSIAEKLGLPAEATEEEIIAAIASLMEKAGKAETMEAEVKAEDILNRNAKRIPAGQRDAWKAELIKNREGAEKLILTLPEAEEKKGEGKPAIFNRQGAGVPDGKFLTEEDEAADDKKATARAAQIRNRANTIAAEQGISFNRAWDRAESEFPA
jgi:phage I-like protein